MTDNSTENPQRLELRKYPNRRYYDVTRSRHVTLPQIRALIRQGHEVQVTDSKTGRDITAAVLAQIILDHDAPKLKVFPVAMLHRLIQTNEQLIGEFVEKYFNRAFMAFFESQQQFDKYMQQMLDVQRQGPAGDWMRAMMGPANPFMFASSMQAQPPQPSGGQSAETADGQDVGQLKKSVEQLSQQLEALQQQMQRREDGRD